MWEKNNVSPQGQKLHSRCHFSAEEYPEESTSSGQPESQTKDITVSELNSVCLCISLLHIHATLVLVRISSQTAIKK